MPSCIAFRVCTEQLIFTLVVFPIFPSRMFSLDESIQTNLKMIKMMFVYLFHDMMALDGGTQIRREQNKYRNLCSTLFQSKLKLPWTQKQHIKWAVRRAQVAPSGVPGMFKILFTLAKTYPSADSTRIKYHPKVTLKHQRRLIQWRHLRTRSTVFLKRHRLASVYTLRETSMVSIKVKCFPHFISKHHFSWSALY